MIYPLPVPHTEPRKHNIVGETKERKELGNNILTNREKSVNQVIFFPERCEKNTLLSFLSKCTTPQMLSVFG